MVNIKFAKRILRLKSKKVSRSLICQASKKSHFTNGELIKLYLIASAKEMCLEKNQLLKTVSLSATTVSQRVGDTGSIISSQFKNKANDLEWFFLAFDESIDVTDTLQYFLFIGGVRATFEVSKELASMNSLYRSTTGKNIFKEIEKTLIQYNLKQNLVRCATTDGHKNKGRAENGLARQIHK